MSGRGGRIGARLERGQFEMWMGNCDFEIAMGENELEKDWGQLQLGRKGANPEADCDFEIAIIVGQCLKRTGWFELRKLRKYEKGVREDLNSSKLDDILFTQYFYVFIIQPDSKTFFFKLEKTMLKN
ncbi:uncharacterized protein Gasu_62420 [Galdieria sulphuraria]|uniref:Uncharacterized protein n=1 Tax=Galdieria sulphuraria TaxID=130081 RepID=M2XR20_GALSU|nr:uncharacterized protein Gasu_62420 [Galdieria sulphuraria]EME26108.1 hypothetical protein Gasu_62420 [Galdieria sulphuraria]|eukprot:XP_005702628.1 hypothetical protein Gasu_62420 [Galdieria sulphuraria]